MNLRYRCRTAVLTGAVLALFLVPPSQAQPAPAVDTFDLVLVGDSLSASTHRVALKTNPTAGAAWTTIGEARCSETERLLVFPAQPTVRYLGQDIRENHLALRVTAETGGGTLRAAYAVPSTNDLDATACAQLARLVETQPMSVRRHSLAAYERPRPAQLRPATPFIDHVEAPIRHRKPGVMEVEWLEILFGPGE